MLEEINVHRDERIKALRAVEDILTEAGRYPFSTGNMGGKCCTLIVRGGTVQPFLIESVVILDDRMELEITDEVLDDLHDRMAGPWLAHCCHHH